MNPFQTNTIVKEIQEEGFYIYLSAEIKDYWVLVEPLVMGPYFVLNANIWVLVGSVFSLYLGPYWVRFLSPRVLKYNWQCCKSSMKIYKLLFVKILDFICENCKMRMQFYRCNPRCCLKYNIQISGVKGARNNLKAYRVSRNMY